VDRHPGRGNHRQNLLEVAFLAAHLLGATVGSRLDTLLDSVTTRAARVMGIRGHELVVGGAADLVVLDWATVREVVGRHAAPRYVIASGRVVAENTSEHRLGPAGLGGLTS